MTKSKILWQLLNWRLHLFVIFISAVCEFLGIVKLPIGVGTLILLPLLYAFILALFFNPNVTPFMARLISVEQSHVATHAVILSVMPFVAKFGVGIGPKVDEIIAAGPALLLQELGNVGTALVALPVAVLIFGMGREAVGATHSIAREPNIALIADKYGLKSAEGIGVMGVYVMGTLFGAIYFSLMAGIVASWHIFDIRALAMACGIGSGSMMGACSAALSEWSPKHSQTIMAFAASSNLLTYATGLFVSLFIALPITNQMYKITKRIRNNGNSRDFQLTQNLGKSPEENKKNQSIKLIDYLILLAFICFVLMISNWVGKEVTLWEAFPGMFILYLCCIMGELIKRMTSFIGIPAIAWTSIVAIIISLPQFPGNPYILEATSKLGVLQLITPVLAYAGFAISKMEVTLFKKSGLKIAVVALLTFTGTFIGSAVIANMLL